MEQYFEWQCQHCMQWVQMNSTAHVHLDMKAWKLHTAEGYAGAEEIAEQAPEPIYYYRKPTDPVRPVS